MFTLKTLFYRHLMFWLRIAGHLLPARQPMIYLGAGASRSLCRHLARQGAVKVLIVTDRMLETLGLLDGITAQLQALGVQWVIFSAVEPDPTYPMVEQGSDLLARENCDCVLGVGGGSPLDVAKVIAAAATNPKPVVKLTGLLKIRRPPLPLYAIPTTAGTGSEVTVAAVISHPDTHAKTPVIDPKLVPLAAALDPDLMTGLPPHITAATGMDALTHAIESYISRHATPDTDRHALAAVRLIMQHLPVACARGEDLEAREAMALASCYAGLALTKANLGYVHGIAHTLGAYYKIPHGLANAMVLPHVLEYSQQAISSRLADMAVAAGVGRAGSSPQVLASRFIDEVTTLSRTIGIPPTVQELREADVPAIARAALKEAHYLYPVPRYMDQRECERLVRKLLPAQLAS